MNKPLCKGESHYNSEQLEYKYWYADGKNYRFFAKRQACRARRRHLKRETRRETHP